MNAEHWLYLATTEIRFPPDQKAVRRELESHLSAAAELAKHCDLSCEQLHKMLRILSEEE